MKWIESNGGPLILVPESYLLLWHGIEEESGSSTTHYDLACSVTEDIAVLRLGQANILVLGDEPFSTAWVQRGRGGLLLRWVYSNGEQSILDFLDNESLDEFLQPVDIVFSTPGGCMLFDSAEPGSEIRGDLINIPLAGGDYEILTALVSPTRDLRLLIHQLVLKQ